MILPSKAKDHTNKRYNRLTVIEPIGKTLKGGYIIWRCKCDCGKITDVKSAHLVSGAVQSCGCLARELSAKRIKQLHNKGKHLYFIQCGNYVKVGRANNINQRLNQIRAMNPHPVQLLRVFLNEGEKEKEWHSRFKEYHHSGEWFKFKDGCETVDIT